MASAAMRPAASVSATVSAGAKNASRGVSTTSGRTARRSLVKVPPASPRRRPTCADTSAKAVVSRSKSVSVLPIVLMHNTCPVPASSGCTPCTLLSRARISRASASRPLTPINSLVSSSWCSPVPAPARCSGRSTVSPGIRASFSAASRARLSALSSKARPSVIICRRARSIDAMIAKWGLVVWISCSDRRTDASSSWLVSTCSTAA